MLLKNQLIEVFKQASLENNSLLKDNVVLKWVHRFGIDSLNDLLIDSSLQKENQHKEENQEQSPLMYKEDEEDEEESHEQIKLELSKNFENIEEAKWESKSLETFSSYGIFSKDQNSKNIKKLNDTQELPLPNIKNLRKWINTDKKAS